MSPGLERLIGRFVIYLITGVICVVILIVVVSGVILLLGGLDCECWSDSWIQRGLF